MKSSAKSYTIIAGADDVGKRVYLNLMQAKPNSLGLVYCDLTSVYLVAKNPVVCMEKGYNFTVETTLLSDEAIQLATMAREKGDEINLHYIGVDERSEITEDNPEKSARLEKLGCQIKNLLKLLPLCDCAVFVDNTRDFRYLAKYRGGSLTCSEEKLPLWLEYIKREFQKC